MLRRKWTDGNDLLPSVARVGRRTVKLAEEERNKIVALKKHYARRGQLEAVHGPDVRKCKQISDAPGWTTRDPVTNAWAGTWTGTFSGTRATELGVHGTVRALAQYAVNHNFLTLFIAFRNSPPCRSRVHRPRDPRMCPQFLGLLELTLDVALDGCQFS